MKKKLSILMMIAVLVFTMTACGISGNSEDSEGSAAASEEQQDESAADAIEYDAIITRDDIEITDTLTNDADGEHAIELSGGTAEYSNTEIIKTGEASGDEADFYGSNSAIFATDEATLDLTDMVITTGGTHANAVFSYGEGTTVNISHSLIETTGNCSGGLMTTGGGTMNATNLTIHTTGNSSAAIRSDRGGGTVTVNGGNYTTEGTGSPVIYSTADITVSQAKMTSTASQGVVVEGKNSVTLNDVDLVADNNTKNSDKSDTYQAVMIYQSMSGDAAVGTSSFEMNGGKLTNKNGDIFFVNNTVTTITLNAAEIINEDADGVFLRAAAAGWGSEGSNGGHVTLTATDQTINGDIIVDDVSTLNLYLKGGSVFNRTINSDGKAGDVYVELTDGAKWVLSGDAYITSLTCEADSIDLNGHKLYVDGVEYEAGTAATGAAVEVPESATQGGGQMDAPPGGFGGEGDGHGPGEGGQGGPGGPGDGGEPPEKPDGDGPGGSGGSGEPPAKPDN